MVAMIDSGSTEVRGGTGAAHLEIARRTFLGMGIGVVVQYALGIWVNLYVTVPARARIRASGERSFTGMGRVGATPGMATGIRTNCSHV